MNKIAKYTKPPPIKLEEFIPQQESQSTSLTSVWLRRPPRSKHSQQVQANTCSYQGHSSSHSLREERDGERRIGYIPRIKGPHGNQQGKQTQLGIVA